MQYQPKFPSTVEAIQYLGGEESALAVITWADGLEEHEIDVVRHLHRNSWNDEPLELWLKAMSVNRTEYATPGAWIVVNLSTSDLDVLTDAAFLEEYQPVVA